ncbi:MAG: ATP-binding cassette domain-containing protein [Sphingobacteriia bacterium]|jgi:putative ABC transport system ATP-binding protein
MEVTYQHVMPRPLADIHNPDTQVWGTELRLQPHTYYEVKSPSGKGKSSFVQILYGIRHDYTGTVHIDGQPTATYSLEQWARLRQRRLSIVFQDLRLFPELTGWENLLLKNELTGHKTEAQIREMCQQLGVDFLLNQACGTMSYGQQQRFAIIRALCQPFELLLLDEPFSHLDQANIRLCTQLITQECAAQQAGLALTTLDQAYPLSYHQHLIL